MKKKKRKKKKKKKKKKTKNISAADTCSFSAVQRMFRR